MRITSLKGLGLKKTNCFQRVLRDFWGKKIRAGPGLVGFPIVNIDGFPQLPSIPWIFPVEGPSWSDEDFPRFEGIDLLSKNCRQKLRVFFLNHLFPNVSD